MVITEDVEKKIIRQVEYYFGDFNLPRDKFLMEETKGNDGWVTMETMLKFKRLMELSSDKDVITAALKKSKAGLMEVNEDSSKIRRNPEIPLPENTVESKTAIEARTVYVKGFDTENTSLDELLDHFNETNTDVVSIQLRNYSVGKGKEKVWKFKGSIFVTFKNPESATAFVEDKEWKYKDKTMIIKFQKNYLEDKQKEMEEKKRNKNQGRGGNKDNKAVKEEKPAQEDDFKMPKGAVLKLTGLGGDITREDIKEVLNTQYEVNIDKDSGDIAFVTYEKGEAEAKIRFKQENAAKPVAEKWTEAVSLKEHKVECSILEGEEEEAFLAKSIQDLKNRRNKNKGHKRKGGFNSGGRGGKRSRR